jgi:drug/metabolite transporter (DMT)-like permease
VIDSNQESLRKTSAKSRFLSVGKPDLVLRWGIGAAIVGALLTALGIVLHLAAGTYGLTVALVVIGVMLFIFGLAFLPSATWSRRHPEEAQRTLALEKKVRDQAMRKHPLLYIGYGIIAGGVLIPLRIAARRHRDHESAIPLEWLIVIGVAGAILVGALFTYLVLRAHRNGEHKDQPASPVGAPPERADGERNGSSLATRA